MQTTPRAGPATDQRPGSDGAASDQTVIFAAVTPDSADDQADTQPAEGAEPDTPAATSDETVIFAALTEDSAGDQAAAQPDAQAAGSDQTVVFAALTEDSAGDQAAGQPAEDAEPDTPAAASDETIILPVVTWKPADDQAAGQPRVQRVSTAEINKHDPSPLTEARHSDQASADAAVTESSMQPKRVLAGLGWNTAGQFLVVGISLGLTPFLLHHLGATLYGIFALVSSVRGLFSNLDAGLAPTGSRYFPVYVGKGDVADTTSLLLTMLTLVAIIVGAVTAAIILVAPAAVGVFALGSGLTGHTHETVQLIRDLMPALVIAAIRTPIQTLVMAHHRWAFLNYTAVIAVMAYAATAVGVSFATPGLQCLIWATYVQEAILLIAAAWAARRYVSLKRLHWLPISEVRQILHFGSRVQIAALASSFNYEVDALLLGFLFPVKYVAYYSIGANFSQQVINIPANGLSPIMQDIGRSYGRSGQAGVLRSFPVTQRMWVTALGIFPMIAALEGWFGIRVWLGHGAQVAAATAVLLVIGTTPLLLNAIVDVTAKVVGMPEIESWYLGIGVAVNVACTVPLALRVGVIGVPLGTAIGQVISFVVCIYLARRKIGKQITPFFHSVRYVPALVAIAVAGVCEWSLAGGLPTGGVGFVLSGLLTVPAFLIYYGWVYPRAFAAEARRPSGRCTPRRTAPSARTSTRAPPRLPGR